MSEPDITWTAIHVAAARCNRCAFTATAFDSHDEGAEERVYAAMVAHAAVCPEVAS